MRKTKGISQEELADKMGVSRQAVSKWESEQSTPDLEKIIILSNFFGVTTDYILKGIEPVEDKEQKSKEITSKVLYISSTAFVAIGLFCAFGGWYAEQTMEAVWGYDYAPDAKNLSSFIRRLRKKVEPDPDNPQYIMTVWGVVINLMGKNRTKKRSNNLN